MSRWRPELLHLGINREGCCGFFSPAIGHAIERKRAPEAALSLAFEQASPSAVTPTTHDFETLAYALRGLGPSPEAVICVLADDLLRYWITDRPRGLRGLAELRGVVKADFESRFGDLAVDWRLICDPWPKWTNDLACAAPLSLLEGLQHVFQSLGVRRWSLAPFLTTAINVHRHKLPVDGFCFAIAQGRTLSVIHTSNCRWGSVQCHAVSLADAETVACFALADAVRHGLELPRTIFSLGIAVDEEIQGQLSDDQPALVSLDNSFPVDLIRMNHGAMGLALMGAIL